MFSLGKVASSSNFEYSSRFWEKASELCNWVDEDIEKRNLKIMPTSFVLDE